MRDVERRFALPWSIYSLSSLPSSGCQSLKEESPNAVGKILQLSNVQPRHALAHSAEQI